MNYRQKTGLFILLGVILTRVKIGNQVVDWIEFIFWFIGALLFLI